MLCIDGGVIDTPLFAFALKGWLGRVAAVAVGSGRVVAVGSFRVVAVGSLRAVVVRSGRVGSLPLPFGRGVRVGGTGAGFPAVVCSPVLFRGFRFVFVAGSVPFRAARSRWSPPVVGWRSLPERASS